MLKGVKGSLAPVPGLCCEIKGELGRVKDESNERMSQKVSRRRRRQKGGGRGEARERIPTQTGAGGVERNSKLAPQASQALAPKGHGAIDAATISRIDRWRAWTDRVVAMGVVERPCSVQRAACANPFGCAGAPYGSSRPGPFRFSKGRCDVPLSHRSNMARNRVGIARVGQLGGDHLAGGPYTTRRGREIASRKKKHQKREGPK